MVCYNSKYILIFFLWFEFVFAQQKIIGEVKYLENNQKLTRETKLMLTYQEDSKAMSKQITTDEQGKFSTTLDTSVDLNTAFITLPRKDYFLFDHNNYLLENNAFPVQINPENIQLLLLKSTLKSYIYDEFQKPVTNVLIFNKQNSENAIMSDEKGAFELPLDCDSLKVPLTIILNKRGYRTIELSFNSLEDIEKLKKNAIKHIDIKDSIMEKYLTEEPVIPKESTPERPTAEVVAESKNIEKNLEELQKEIDQTLGEETINEKKLKALKSRAESLQLEISDLKKEVRKMGPKYANLLRDSENKDQTIQKLLGRLEVQEHELKVRRLQNTYAIILIVVLLVVIIFIFRNRRVLHKKNKELQQKNIQIQFLIDEMEHRVGNNLKNISSILNMRSKKSQTLETKEALQNMNNIVQAMHFLHQDLSYNEKLEKIDLSAYLEKLSQNIKKVLLPRNPLVNFEIDIQGDILLNNRQAMDLALIVNELLTNAFKHAFQEIEHPRLLLKLWEEEQKIKLLVKDNGKGADLSVIKSSNRLGIKLINGFGKKMNANFELRNNGGLECIYSFNKENINISKHNEK